MYYKFYESALYDLENISIEDYVLNNDFSSLFEKYDEGNYILLRGIESRIIMICRRGAKNIFQKKVIKKVRRDFMNVFLKNPRKYFDSFLINSSYYKKIFSFFEVRKIDKIINSIHKEARDLLVDGPSNSKDRHFLMKYLKNHIDLDDVYQKKLILEMLDNNFISDDLEECNFFYSYVSRWMLRESGYGDVNPYVFTTVFPEDRIDAGYANGEFICMRQMNDSPIDCIKRICHETRHIIQNIMYKRLGRSSYEHEDSVVGFDYLEHYVFDDAYYENNYWFSRIELDAEKVGIDFALKFLSSFGRENLSRGQIHNQFFRKQPYEFAITPICQKGGVDFQKDFFEYSRVSMWDEIVKNDFYLLDEYPILSRLYDGSGNKISFEDMMKNDFSTSDNLELFYDYIFTYIQEGSLDKIQDVDDLFFNNLKLVYERVTDKIKKMVDFNPFILNDIDNGLDLPNDEIRKIFTSEIVYYYSFVTKVSKFLNKNISYLNDSYRNDFAKDVDVLLGKSDLLFKDCDAFMRDDSSFFLDSNISDLLLIHNELRSDEALAIYTKLFDKLVPDKFKDTEVFGLKFSDYVSQVLPLCTSYLDISKVIIDGKEKRVDDYILELVSDRASIEIDFSEISILLNLIRKNFAEEDFWDGLCFRMRELINYYEKKDADFAKILSTSFSLALDEHYENVLSTTPLYVECQVFSDEVKEVISRVR